jgi:hypothetical protein
MPAFTSPDPRNLLVGRGTIAFDIYDSTGTPTGTLVPIGNCTLFEVSDKAEVKEKYSSQDPAGNLLARAVTRQTFSIKITADEFTCANLAAALNGTVTGDGISSGSTVAIGTVASVEAHVQFIGNPVKGPAYQHDYWHVSFVPTGNIGFIKDDFAELGLEGVVIADTVGHPASPMGLMTLL